MNIFLKKNLGEEFSEIIKKERMEIYVTEQILKEISRVLVYPKISELLKLSGVSARDIIQNIMKISILIGSKFKLSIIKDDLEDNKILDCALQAKTDFIVSGDRHLLKLKI